MGEKSGMWKGLAILIVGAALGVAVAVAYENWTGPSPTAARESTPSANTRPGDLRQAVVALGTIEPADGIVQVASPLVGYRIERVHVQEGQLVKQGDLLIELENSATQAELLLAQAQEKDAAERQQAEIAIAGERVASAELGVQQAQAARQLETDSARKRLELAELKANQARQDLEHVLKLRQLAEPLASEQQVQHQRLAMEAAEAEHQAARAASQQVEQSLQFREQTAAAELRAARRSQELAQQGVGLESLKQGVRLAQLKLQQTKILSPIDGTVVDVRAHPGEIIAQQPLLQLANLAELVCIAEVEAADVPLLKPGQSAVVHSRAFGDAELSGKLERVGSAVGAANLRPLDPRQPVDRSVARAVVQLDTAHAARLISYGAGDRRAALIGLQVEVEFPLATAP